MQKAAAFLLALAAMVGVTQGDRGSATVVAQSPAGPVTATTVASGTYGEGVNTDRTIAPNLPAHRPHAGVRQPRVALRSKEMGGRRDKAFAPTDDSLWIIVDSVSQPAPGAGYIHYDVKARHDTLFVLVAYPASGVSRVQILNRLTGALLSQFSTHSNHTGWTLCTIGDSCFVFSGAVVGSEHVDVYRFNGGLVRSFNTPSGYLIQGFDWDGRRLWCAGRNGSARPIFTMSTTGAMLRILNPSGPNPAWPMGLACDSMSPLRLWVTDEGVVPGAVHYISTDTVANLYQILATYQHPTRPTDVPEGIGLWGPDSSGCGYVYTNSDTSSSCWKVLVHAGPDVCVTRILAPAGTIDSGAPCVPACSVYNYGRFSRTYGVRMRVGSAYNQTATVIGHPSGTRQYITFPASSAWPRGSHTVVCSTELAGDVNQSNDRQTSSVNVRVLDAQVVSIVAPSGTVDSGTSLTPQANVRNNGTANATFGVRLDIGGWSNTQTVTSLAPGATQLVSFASWAAVQRGASAVRCTSFLSGDVVPANNLVAGSVTVRVLDAEAVSIVSPSGPVDSGVTLTPQASVRNAGTDPATFGVRFDIGTWSNAQSVTGLTPGATRLVSFALWTATQRGTFSTRCTTLLLGDMVPTNNLQSGSVSIEVTDAEVLSITAPVGTLDSGTVVTPQAAFRNNGTAAATFNVRFDIDSWTSTRTVTDLAPAASQLVNFAPWTAVLRGTHVTKCTTLLDGDLVPGNNFRTGTVSVSVIDAEAEAIVAPLGVVDSGAAVTPQAAVRNNGTASATFDVTFSIGAWSNTQNLTLTAGNTRTVDFANWTADRRGSFGMRCTTLLVGDMVGDNNLATGSVSVAVHDIAAIAVVAPVGVINRGPVTPRATCTNHGTIREACAVTFAISPSGYASTVALPAGLPFVDTVIDFPSWVAANGSYATRCSTYLASDQIESNDVVSGGFEVINQDTGWVRRADVPAGARNKRVKDGGCLAYVEGVEGSRCQVVKGNPLGPSKPRALETSGFIYALKGNGRCEYYRYNIAANAWVTKESIPAIGSSGKRKAVKKGAAMATADSRQFAAKGNNTLEWWCYDPHDSTLSYPWKQKLDVPAGAKTCRQGCGAATVRVGDTTYIYFLKGSATNEFYRYNTTSDIWSTMAPAPLGTSGKTYKDGSCIAASDDGTTIYALKGNYNELFAYDVAANVWTTRTGMPLTGSSGKKKKVKSGAGIACHRNTAYALKGNNTQEFWKYASDSNKWQQAEDMPIGGGKRVKGGGALVYAAQPAPALHALKGNNTLEFWSYGLATYDRLEAASFKPQAQGSVKPQASSFKLEVNPNPFAGATVIRYTLPKPGNATLSLYDITGQLVTTLASGHHNAGASSLSLQASSLPAGIYVLRLSTETTTLTQKLIVE